MPRPKKQFPIYRRHHSGLARVTIEGRDHYLGKYGTPESRERYERLMLDWKQGQIERRNEQVAPVNWTVAALVAAYWRNLLAEGRYRKNGKPTSERQCIAAAMRPLVRLFGSAPAASFTPQNLQTVRAALAVRPPRQPKEGAEPAKAPPRPQPSQRARSTVNKHLHRIRRMFRWAVSAQIVPASVWHALQAVEGLRRGQTEMVREPAPVRPVEWPRVAKTLPHLHRQVKAMVLVQWHTGARPGEVCGMRLRDIDRTGPVWIYRPASHKTEHLGQERIIPLGPQAQAVLLPFLQAAATDGEDAYLFSPQVEMIERCERRHAERKTPPWPSHLAKRRPPEEIGAAVGVCYEPASYRRAITRACEAAEVEPWNPNQLRHAAATRIRAAYGLEAAKCVLGHSTIGTTQHYAEQDLQRALQVAGEVG